jgi:hypothetical protein
LTELITKLYSALTLTTLNVNAGRILTVKA